MSDVLAAAVSRARSPAKGRQASAPTVQAIQVTSTADSRETSGFWRIRLTAYAAAETRHRSTPTGSRSPVVRGRRRDQHHARERDEQADAQHRGGPLLEEHRGQHGHQDGESWISIAAVPASTRRSPALSATL